MYLPQHFAEPRVDELHRIIREHPLGMLVTTGPAGLDANHIPFEFDAERGPHGTLLAHVARANPLCTEFAAGADGPASLIPDKDRCRARATTGQLQSQCLGGSGSQAGSPSSAA